LHWAWGCKTACPTNAITLVFGTERRGIDIPNVDEHFQTNVPGIFVAAGGGNHFRYLSKILPAGPQSFRKITLIRFLPVECEVSQFSPSEP
jgi:hypothetical protein